MIEVFDQHGNKMFEVSPMQGGSNKNGKQTEEEIEDGEKFISEARAILEDMKKKGNISGKISQYLSQLLKVEIPWEELVEKSIKTNTIMKPDDRSWRSLNKFYQPHGIHLPGYSLSESNEGIGTLIICVDRSGSINKKELKQFSYIIEQSMKYFKVIKVLIHDIKIHQEKEFNIDNIIEFYKFIKTEGYKGGGGTSHKYVFEKIQTIWEEDPNEISMCISLTDMYSDIKELYKKQEFIKNNLPFVFIITSSGQKINIDKDFGEITQIKIK